jgi:hypothetical protein
MNQPQQFLSEDDVRVTSSLIQIGGQTFSTPNITSVRLKEPSRAAAIVLAVIFGILAIVAGANGLNPLCVLVPIGLAVLLLFRQKSELYLVTAGGEVKAMSTTDRAKCQRIHHAIVQAMHACGR